MERLSGEGGRMTCERVKEIKRRTGHRGRVREQEGGGTKRGEGRARPAGGEQRWDTGWQSEEEE